MRLPHWLCCRWSKWSGLEHIEAVRRIVLADGTVPEIPCTIVRQTRACESCGKIEIRIL